MKKLSGAICNNPKSVKYLEDMLSRINPKISVNNTATLEIPMADLLQKSKLIGINVTDSGICDSVKVRYPLTDTQAMDFVLRPVGGIMTVYDA